MKEEELLDSQGNVIKKGDLVIYADNWPDGRKPYIGIVSHVTESNRIAIRPQRYEGKHHPHGAYSWNLSQPVDYYHNANTYRYPKTLIVFKHDESSRQI